MLKGIYFVCELLFVCLCMWEHVYVPHFDSWGWNAQRDNTDLCDRMYRDEALRRFAFLKFITKPTAYFPHDSKIHHCCIKQSTC